MPFHRHVARFKRWKANLAHGHVANKVTNLKTNTATYKILKIQKKMNPAFPRGNYLCSCLKVGSVLWGSRSPSEQMEMPSKCLSTVINRWGCSKCLSVINVMWTGMLY